jgi:2-keto-4-pentenoate hydratase/2-oxohepta-3-ene-1,7-dioic acid hydratase in catechol pathway
VVRLALIDDFRPAVVVDGRVCDLAAALPDVMALPERMRTTALIEGWDAYAQRVATAMSPGSWRGLREVRLRAPVPRPGKLLCAQLSFREGIPDAVAPPTFFLKSSSSVIGPDDVVELSPVDAAVFHHEAELAVVIGRRAKAVSRREAMSHVFGYTCFLDLSARGVGPGTSFQDKSYDTFGPMGPWILTADEIADPHALTVRLWVDGEVRHDYPMSDIGTPVAEMIATASAISTLEPGDVLALGVNHQGLGPIQDGETLRIEIEPIGGFEVRVRDPLERRWVKGVDHAAAAWVRSHVARTPGLGPPAWAERLDR